MTPALGRRTAQKPLPEGRPKRQAVLNRKDNVDIAKGTDKGTVASSKKELSAKKNEKTNAAKNNKPKPTKGKGSGKTAKKSTKSTRKSSRITKKAGEGEGDEETEKETEESEEETEEESQEHAQEGSQEDGAEETEHEESGITEDGEKISKKESTQQQGEEQEDNEGGEEKSSSDEESIPDDGALDDDDDSDFDPNDDPDKLWCFCKKPHGNRFMICCDTCEDWFHGDCVGISMAKGREMEKTGEEWCCRLCKENAAKKAARERNMPNAHSALNSPVKHPGQKPLDPATLSKARSVSLDSIKNNLGKKIKDRNIPSSFKNNEETIEDNPEDKTSHTEGKPTSKPQNKRRESAENSLSGLLTFDHVPTAAMKKVNPSPRKLSTERRESLEEKKRKDSQIKPHKVRTTPTPKTVEPLKACHRTECSKPILKGSIFCSRECIYRYSNECIKLVELERKKNAPEASTSTKGSTVISPAHSTTEFVPTETSQERIAVFEKSSGKIVAGVMAPTKKYLFAWLEEHPTYQVLLQSGKQEIKNPKKNQDEIVRGNVRKTLKEVLANRCKESHTAINVEAVGFICKKIEQELLKMFGETNNKYRTKYRSLIFNLKDQNNKVLYKRVVSGEITPNKLVTMSPEQLAAPELAAWREHESKHGIEMIKKRELEDAELRKKFSGIKKTHKGEVAINDENMETLETKIEPEPERKPSTTEEQPTAVPDILKDTTEEHSNHLFDSNCKICTGKMTPPGENQITGVSTTVIQAIPESSVPSPTMEDNLSILSSPHTPEDSTISLTPTSPVATKNPPSARKQPSVWRGFVMMQKVAKFVCTAYAVSGSCENLMETLPDTIHICGRIPPNQVWEYLAQLKEGRKNYKYIDVIRFEMSSDEEKSGYIKLYTYFYTRQRIGVVGNCYSGVKDMYILPLASHDAIPDELKPLPGLPKPRPHMLVGIIVRLKSKKKADTITSIDSSPEIAVPKKKKKKKKEKEQLEKEKIEIEAQKKLIDIIFKNRSTDLAISTASSTTNTESGTSTSSGQMVDSMSLLKSLTSSSEQAKTPTEGLEKAMEVDQSAIGNDTNDGELVTLDDPYEEEQLRLMKEQQEEIEKLKAKLNVNTPNDDGEHEKDQKNDFGNRTPPKSDTDNETLQQKDGTPIKIPDPDSMAKTLREDVMNVAKTLGNEPDETTEEDFSREILREAFQRTKQTEQKEAEEKFKDGPHIPLLGSSIPEKTLSSSEETHKATYSTTPSFKSILSRDKAATNQPSDDDYVTNLIENIEIPTQREPKLPLDVLKEKKTDMPELPAISLPSPSDLAAILTAIPPQVPLPPNIKLPPGVPFPPLPPPPPAKTKMADPRRRPSEDSDERQWRQSDGQPANQPHVSEAEYRRDPHPGGPPHDRYGQKMEPPVSREPPFRRGGYEHSHPEQPPASGNNRYNERELLESERRYPPTQEGISHTPHDAMFPLQERSGPNQKRMFLPSERGDHHAERMLPPQERGGPPQDRMIPSQDRIFPPQEKMLLPQDMMLSPHERGGPDGVLPVRDRGNVPPARGDHPGNAKVYSWREYERRRKEIRERENNEGRSNDVNDRFPTSQHRHEPQSFENRPPVSSYMQRPPMEFHPSHMNPPHMQNDFRPRGPHQGDIRTRLPPGPDFQPRRPSNRMEFQPRGPHHQDNFPPREPRPPGDFQAGRIPPFQAENRGSFPQETFRHPGPRPQGEFRARAMPEHQNARFPNPRFPADPRFRGPAPRFDNGPRFPPGPQPDFNRNHNDNRPRMFGHPQEPFQARPPFHEDGGPPFHAGHSQNQPNLADNTYQSDRNHPPHSASSHSGDHRNQPVNDHRREFNRNRNENDSDQNRFHRDHRDRATRHDSRQRHNRRGQNDRKRRHSESSDKNTDPWGRDRRWHENKIQNNDAHMNPKQKNKHDLEDGELP